jgi:hypothetical protein
MLALPPSSKDKSPDPTRDSLIPHILPCCVHHDGVVEVLRRYWDPTLERAEDSGGMAFNDFIFIHWNFYRYHFLWAVPTTTPKRLCGGRLFPSITIYKKAKPSMAEESWLVKHKKQTQTWPHTSAAADWRADAWRFQRDITVCKKKYKK